MNRFLAFVALSLFGFGVAQAQSKRAELLQKLHQQDPKSEAYQKALFNLVDITRARFPDSTIKYAQLSLDHNPKKEQPYYFKAKMFIADAHSIKGQLALADSLFRVMKYQLKEHEDSVLKADYFNGWGINFAEMGMIDSSIYCFRESYGYIRNINKLEAAKCLNNIGADYMEMNNLDSGFIYYLKAYDIRKQEADTPGIETSLANLAVVMGNMGKTRESIDYAHAGLQLRGMGPIKAYFAMATLVNGYKHLDMRDSAFFWSSKRIEEAEKLGNPYYAARALAGRGELFRHYGEYDSALYYLLKALPVLESRNDSIGNRLTYESIGLAYMNIGDYPKALNYLSLARRLFQEIQDEPSLMITSRALLETRLRKAGDLIGVDLLHEINDLADSIKAREIAAVSNELMVKYETEKAKNTLLEREQELSDANVRISRKNLWILALAGLATILTLIITLIYRNRKAREKALLQEIAAKEQAKGLKQVIDAGESERQRIARELHDGLGQQLNGLRFQLAALEEELMEVRSAQAEKVHTVIEQLGEAANEVRDLSHSMMPRSLELSGLEGAIRDTLSIHATAYEWDFQANVENEESFSFEERLSLYRIFQEALSNIFKHANAKNIRVQLKLTKGLAELTVQDDGEGFDVELAAQGIGLQNMKYRMELIGGQILVDSSRQTGTRITARLSNRG